MSKKTMKLVYKSTNKFKNIQKKSLKRGRPCPLLLAEPAPLAAG